MHHNQTVKAKADEGNLKKLQATSYARALRKINVLIPYLKYEAQKAVR